MGCKLVHTSKDFLGIWDDVSRATLFKGAIDDGCQRVFGPADSLWNQGAVEALAKSAKHCSKDWPHEPVFDRKLCSLISLGQNHVGWHCRDRFTLSSDATARAIAHGKPPSRHIWQCGKITNSDWMICIRCRAVFISSDWKSGKSLCQNRKLAI